MNRHRHQTFGLSFSVADDSSRFDGPEMAGSALLKPVDGQIEASRVASNVTRSRIFAFMLSLSPVFGIAVLTEENNPSRKRGGVVGHDP